MQTISRRRALGLAGAALLPAPAFAQALPTRDIAFGAHPRQRLDIYLPLDGGIRRPVLFFIYGGSWSSGSKGTYFFVGNALAARGYVTVIADYRLVPQVRFPTSWKTARGRLPLCGPTSHAMAATPTASCCWAIRLVPTTR